MPDLATTYAGLPVTSQRLYRLLGAVLPGPDVTVAAAALAELGEDDAEAALETLAAVQLARRRVRPGALARYRLTDDAVRDHARKVGLGEAEHDRAEALRRLTNYYRLACVAVAKSYNPDRWYLGPDYDVPPIIGFPSQRAALAWVDAERGNLHAIARAACGAGFAVATWQLVEGQWSWYFCTRAASGCIDDHTLGHEAAAVDGDSLAQARKLEGRACGGT